MRILTFDIEEWFHILDNPSTKTDEQWCRFEPRLESNVARILDILDRHDQKATFFCLGWVARHYPKVIKDIVKRRHEIATHSDSHQLVYEQTPEEFRADLERSIKCLEDTSGQKVRAYRAPGFSLMETNKWLLEELIVAGIEIDSSVFPVVRAHGGIKAFGAGTPTLVKTESGTLKEFPINTHRILGQRIVFSGGGYFRLFPGALIRRFSARSDYVMTYFHPRDFDSGQPMILGLSMIQKFRAYYGLKSAQRKLEEWLAAEPFCDLASGERLIDWGAVPCVTIQEVRP